MTHVVFIHVCCKKKTLNVSDGLYVNANICQCSPLIETHNIPDCRGLPCAGPWFSVEAKNEERGVAGVSYLRKLYVTVDGITVTLMKSSTTLVSI